MELHRIIAFRGPNVYFPQPALEVLLNCRGWRDERTNRLCRRLSEHIGFLTGRDCQPSRLAAGAAPRLFSASTLESVLRTPPAVTHTTHISQILEQIVRSLHFLAGVNTEYGEVRETDDPDIWIFVVQFEEEGLARACLQAAHGLCLAAADDQPFSLPQIVRELVDLADDLRLGPSTRAIVDAATSRGIPYRRLNRASLVQLGEGCKQRRIWTAETDATSAIAESIASDKDLTKRLLAAAGVPVPRGRVVANAEDAWKAACEIGLPAVVKPQKANHARGVSLDLTTREQIMSAFDFAVQLGDDGPVMVEQFAPGQQHRLLVVGDRMVAAACGESEYVVGDGKHTVAELVESENSDPRRGVNYTDLLGVLRIDASAQLELTKQGLTPESVPLPGQRVLVQQIGDLTMDCTLRVHPNVAARAVLAAQTVGLDIAGLDVVAEDISRPLEEQRGMILEVNAGPSLSMHIAPLHGDPQPVGAAIVDLMFPDGANGRIPVVAITGTGHRPAVAQELADIVATSGYQFGLATSVVRSWNQHIAETLPANDWQNVESLLLHKFCPGVIFESRPEQAAREGIGTPRSDVVIVTGKDPRSESRSEADRAGIMAAIHSLDPAGTLILPYLDSDSEWLISQHRGPRVRYALNPVSGTQDPRLNESLVFLRGNVVHFSGPQAAWSLTLPTNKPADICLPAVVAAFVLKIPPHDIYGQHRES